MFLLVTEIKMMRSCQLERTANGYARCYSPLWLCIAWSAPSRTVGSYPNWPSDSADWGDFALYSESARGEVGNCNCSYIAVDRSLRFDDSLPIDERTVRWRPN